MTRTLTVLACLAALPAWAQAPAPQTPQGGACAADRDPESGRNGERLHLPQRQPPGDVHRHARRRDRHRPGRLRQARRRPGLRGRDQEGHPGADQVPDLQPPPLRPHRRRQGVQGRGRHDHRPQAGQGAPRGPEGSARRSRTRPWTTRRTIKLGGTTLELPTSASTTPTATLVMRLPKDKSSSSSTAGRRGPGPRHDRLLSARGRALDQADPGDGLGAPHPGHPGRRPAGHQEGRAGPAYRLLQDASEYREKPRREGKCWDAAEKELQLEKYKDWPGYANNLPFVLAATAACGAAGPDQAPRCAGPAWQQA